MTDTTTIIFTIIGTGATVGIGLAGLIIGLARILRLQIDGLTARLDAAERANAEAHDALNQRITDQFAAVNQRMGEQFAAVNQRMGEQFAAVNRRIDDFRGIVLPLVQKHDAESRTPSQPV